jgi:hypothetical protein
MFTPFAPDAPRVALVGCSKEKLERPAPAQAFYTSSLFAAALAYAQASCAEVYIVSAKYDLLKLDEIVHPYDLKLDELRKAERENWGCRAVSTFQDRKVKPRLVVLAGKLYAEALTYGAHWHNMPRPEQPLAKVSGVGARIARLGELARQIEARELWDPLAPGTPGDRAWLQYHAGKFLKVKPYNVDVIRASDGIFTISAPSAKPSRFAKLEEHLREILVGVDNPISQIRAMNPRPADQART